MHFWTLREKCPYSELFWSVVFRIQTEYEKHSVSLRIQSECGKVQTRITPNTDTFYAVWSFEECTHAHEELIHGPE